MAVVVAVAARHLRLRQQVHHPLELARAAARVDGDAIVDGGRGEVVALHLPQQLHHVPRLLGRGARAHHSFVRVHRRVDAAHLKIWEMRGQIWDVWVVREVEEGSHRTCSISRINESACRHRRAFAQLNTAAL